MMTRSRVRKHFASGECAICWCMAAAHRTVDAIRDRHKVGETIKHLAADYEIPRDIVSYIVRSSLSELEWLRRVRRSK